MLDILKQLALNAGQEIMKVYESVIEVQTKDDESPLTQADLAADKVIRQGLEESFPGVFIWSEESTSEGGQTPDRFFLVDPLDGTKEFIKRNGEFTVNIALIESGRPTAAVVYAPALNELFYAQVGQGAWREVKDFSEVISVSNASKVTGDGVTGNGVTSNAVTSNAVTTNAVTTNAATGGVFAASEIVGNTVANSDQNNAQQAAVLRVLGSRSHGLEALEAWLERLGGRYELESVGSSLKFCRIAQGQADVYPRFGPTCQWDTAAGQCIVECAGGVVLDMAGEALIYGLDKDKINPDFVVGRNREVCGFEAS